MRSQWCSASSICAWLSTYDCSSATSSWTIFARPFPSTVFAPAVEVSRERGKTTRISTNWCARDVDRLQRRPGREPGRDALDPARMAVDAVARAPGRAGEHHHRREAPERRLPLVSPDLHVHVDDVVVGDCEAAEAVGDREGALLVERRVVPDDAHLVRVVLDAVPAGSVAAAELRVPARLVRPAVLGHEHVVDRLALAERDVAVRAAERAGEGEADVLADEQRAVLRDPHVDVRLRERVRLRRRDGSENERRDGRDGRGEQDESAAVQDDGGGDGATGGAGSEGAAGAASVPNDT